MKQITAVASQAEQLAGELISMHVRKFNYYFAERYALAAAIAGRVSVRTGAVKKVSTLLDNIVLHPIFVISCFPDAGSYPGYSFIVRWMVTTVIGDFLRTSSLK
jgi:hypothetical protein